MMLFIFKTALSLSFALLLCILVLAFIWGYRRLSLKYLKQEEWKKEDVERKRKEELYNAKIEFFTNIAHEIRTPLTLIKIPLEYILTTSPDHDDLISNLQIMSRNTDRLLELVNQLLDFRKIEESKYTLTLKNYNITDILSDTVNSFVPSAERKQIDMTLFSPGEPIIAEIDREAITKVLSNLFTNALKHASTYVRTSLSLTPDGSCFLIRVNNDGKRIPDNMRNKIFEAFCQIKDTEDYSNQTSGSGLGLAFSSRLVGMHNGDIYLDTDAPDTSFVMRIPLHAKLVNRDNHTDDGDDLNATGIKFIGGTEKIEKAVSILAVDDNEELRSLLVTYMEKRYNMITAADGVEAMKIIKKNLIDIVITDVMMPRMDGIELCRQIKTNDEFFHIPVIMLTAKTKVVDKIESLKCGADAYIEKPFNIDQLIAQIDNLIERNRKLATIFRETPTLDMGQIAINKMDEQYLDRVKGIILEHIEDENYDLDNLSEDMNTSKSSLHRKIKGVTQMAPGEFIRVIRLKKAAELLRDGGYRVNEVCYMVGIRSLSSFSKSFQKQFGILPKDFAKKR